MGRSERKRPLERPMHRWDDIKMDLQEVACGAVDWIDVVQDRGMWGCGLD